MSSLYQLVDEVLNEQSMHEAEKKFYGNLVLNSQEYYETVISEFVQKKESLIKKEGKKIIYDLNEHKEDLWNIVFLSMYVHKFWEETRVKIDEEKKALMAQLEEKKKHDPYDPEINTLYTEIQRLNNLYNSTAEYSRHIGSLVNEGRNAPQIIIEGLEQLDSEKLSKQIEELKKAIIVLEKIRGSFAHRGSNTVIDELVSINNIKNKFRTVIPISYLDSFNKGGIKVKTEDKELIKKTNDISFPILTAMNYDPKQLRNFFYNVSPNILTKLIHYCNNDVKLLYLLPEHIFNFSEFVIDCIFEYARRNGINTIDEYVEFFKKKSNIIRKIIEHYEETEQHDMEAALNFLEFIDNHNYNEFDIITLNGVFLKDLKKLTEFMEYLYNKNINIKSALNNYNYLEDKYLLDIDNYEKFFNYFSDTTKYPDYRVDIKLVGTLSKKCLADKVIPYMDVMLKHNVPPEILESIILKCEKTTPEKLEEIIVHLEQKDNLSIWDLTTIFRNLENPSIELIDKALDITHRENSPIPTNIKYEYWDDTILDTWKKIVDNSEEINQIIGSYIVLPKNAFNNYDETMKKLQLLKNIGFNKEVIFRLLFDTRYKINNLFWDDLERNIEFINQMDTKYENGISTDTLLNILNNKELFTKLEDYLALKNIDKTYIFEIVHSDYFNIGIDYKKLIAIFELAFKHNVSLEIPLNYSSKIINESIDNIDLFFSKKVFNINIYDSETEHSRFEHRTKQIIECISYFNKKGIEIDLLNQGITKLYKSTYQINWKNIDILLEKVNNDYKRLEEFPEELFTCDTELLFSMLANYNTNICMSIFGINNPKIIASLVYTNSVLSRLDIKKDLDNLSLIDANYFVEKNKEDTINYSHLAIDQYERQFLYDEKNNPIGDNQSKYIINKLRNFIAHFRFKLVKDENGHVFDDKILLYDMNNFGVNNFNVVIDLNYLVSIVRSIEVQLDIIKEKLDEPESSNSISR